MKFYGIENIGTLTIEKVATLPSWTSADEGRTVYNENDGLLYTGNSSEWITNAVQKVDTLPSWTSADEGRIVYNKADDLLYFGTSSAWVVNHTQGTDTSLGAQSENLDMNTHKIVGVVDPTADQEAATKKYVDDNATTGSTGLPLVQPNACSLDDTNIAATRGSVFSMVETIDFAASADGSVWFTFHFSDELNASSDLSLDLIYNLSGSDDSKYIIFTVDYWVYADGVTPTAGSSDGSNTNTISSGSSQDGTRRSASLTAIPSLALTVNNTLTLKITREGANGSDTYSGILQMLHIFLSQ